LGGEGVWTSWVREEGFKPLVFGSGQSSESGLMLIACWRLVLHIRKNPVDIIYVCGARAAFILRFVRVFFPEIKLVHGVRWNPISNSNLDRFFRLMERLTHSRVDAWIANSEAAKRTLISICGIPSKKVHVIYNGLESVPNNIVALNKRPMLVLTVANLSPRKGHVEYLLIIQQLVKKIPNLKFVFVGRDNMNGRVQECIDKMGLGNFVFCKGFQGDVSKWYQQARLFVLPSQWGEGCPTSILEAHSYGVPVVAYKIDGIPEIVEDNKDGMLIDKNDKFAFKNAIIDLIENESIAAKMGEAGSRKINYIFTIDQCAVSHSSFFEEIMD